MTADKRIALQCAALVLIWSTSFLWIKLLVVEIPPTWLAVWRLLLGALVLSLAAWLTRDKQHKQVQHSIRWPVIAVAATFGNAFPYLLIHAGEVTVDSGVAAVLMGTMPLATFAFARFILGERLTKLQLGGLALGFLGLLVLTGSDSLAGLGGSWGQLLIAAGAACYALSATLVRKLGSTASLSSAAITLWLAAGFVLSLAIWHSPAPVLPSDTTGWVALLILGPVCTGGAAALYFQLLGQVPANKFAQINYIIPLLGYFWGLLFMGETLRWQAILAAILILMGVRAVLKGQRKQ